MTVLSPKPSCVVSGELGLSSVCLEPLRRALVRDGSAQKPGALQLMFSAASGFFLAHPVDLFPYQFLSFLQS